MSKDRKFQLLSLIIPIIKNIILNAINHFVNGFLNNSFPRFEGIALACNKFTNNSSLMHLQNIYCF